MAHLKRAVWIARVVSFLSLQFSTLVIAFLPFVFSSAHDETKLI